MPDYATTAAYRPNDRALASLHSRMVLLEVGEAFRSFVQVFATLLWMRTLV